MEEKDFFFFALKKKKKRKVGQEGGEVGEEGGGVGWGEEEGGGDERGDGIPPEQSQGSFQQQQGGKRKKYKFTDSLNFSSVFFHFFCFCFCFCFCFFFSISSNRFGEERMDSSDMEDVLGDGDDDMFLQEALQGEKMGWDMNGREEGWDFDGGSGKGKKMFGEIKEILILFLGALGSRISYVAIKTTDSALLGHTPSPDALTVSSYSDLYTAAVGVFLTSGVLSMFVGNAIGSGNLKMAGVWLQISLYFVLFMTLPVMILWFLTSPVLQLFGVSERMANQAGYYSTVLAFCLPFRSIYRQLTQFLAAQKIVFPGTITGILGCGFNLVMGLIFVLGIPIPSWEGFGFPACPIVTLVTEILMCLLFYLVFFALLRLHDPCWDGRDPSLFTDIEKYKEFGKFYLPTALAAASDWWRVVAIGVVAAYLGPTQLAVFNTSYRILWMSLTIVGSLASAISIKLGIFVGAGDISSAKQMILLGTCFTFLTLGVLCVIGWFLIEEIAQIFSDKEEIIQTFVDSKMGICCMLFVMNLSVFLERIPNTLGKNKQVLYSGLIGSWCGQVPAVLALCHWVSWSLNSIYMGASIGYALTCFLLIIIIVRVDWIEAVKEAKERSGVAELRDGEEGREGDDDDEVWGVEGEIEMENMGIDWEKFVEKEEDQDL